MNITEILMPFLFFLIALIYSSVGFAGGSSYLLILTLAGISHESSAAVALVCNLAVSSVTFWRFFKAGHFHFRLVLPFMALSIPMAYFGATLSIEKQVFYFLLGASLALAAFRLYFLKESYEKRSLNFKKIILVGLPAGGVMGFFSGLIGIGGGIFLSPFLIFTRLANLKEASAAASFFIFVNSLSGLVGKAQSGFYISQDLTPLIFAAFFGGFIGSQYGCERLSWLGSKKILASLVFFISSNSLMKAFS